MESPLNIYDKFKYFYLKMTEDDLSNTDSLKSLLIKINKHIIIKIYNQIVNNYFLLII